MGKKYLQAAAREGRVAVLPAWIQEGRTVWYWRETLCDDDLCPDMVGPSCPMNRMHGAARYGDPEARGCARLHPVLDSMELWSVAAQFTPRGIVWALNEDTEISDAWLRLAVFPSKEEALQHRPRRIEYG